MFSRKLTTKSRRIKATRLRLCVRVTDRHVYAQIIDDTSACTLAWANSCEDEHRANEVRSNVVGARVVGQSIAGRALQLGIKDVSFDRGAHRYHGVIAALADSARLNGLRF